MGYNLKVFTPGVKIYQIQPIWNHTVATQKNYFGLKSGVVGRNWTESEFKSSPHFLNKHSQWLLHTQLHILGWNLMMSGRIKQP